MLDERSVQTVSPVIPPQEQHHDPEPPKADSSEPYVTRSGRRVVKPERLDRYTKLGTKNHFQLLFSLKNPRTETLLIFIFLGADLFHFFFEGRM